MSNDSWEWLDNLTGSQQQSLIDEIVAQEEQSRISQQTEINKVLVMAIAQLEPQLQKIVQLLSAARVQGVDQTRPEAILSCQLAMPAAGYAYAGQSILDIWKNRI
ncbi:hypothetical protein [Nostoc sp.]|uniref:hypothetical protein n=1 Tax=Nostoc sp. TaxID=1180 RepID=UPI002FF4C20E